MKPSTQPVYSRASMRTLMAMVALSSCFLEPALAQRSGETVIPDQRSTDTLTTKEGQRLNGKITSLQDGKIYIEAEGGVQTFDKEDVTQFSIQRGDGSAIYANLLQQMLDTQNRMAQRIESMAASLANLERQQLTVQSNQQINAQRMNERTVEVNPISRVTVVDRNVVRSGGNTLVRGRVINQSESPVSNLQVQVSLYASRGQIASRGGVVTTTGAVNPSTLGPGQMGEYEVEFEGFLIVDNSTVQVVSPGTFGGIPYGALPGQTNPSAGGGSFGEY